MADKFPAQLMNRQLHSPGERFVAVTPDDANGIETTRGIIVGVAGNVQLTGAANVDGSSVVVPLAAGIIHPIRAKQIWAASTTATGIVAVY